MLRLRFTDFARNDLAEAVEYYRAEAGPERAVHFRNAIKRVVFRACRFPLSARIIHHVEGLDLHCFVVPEYPYLVVTAPLEQVLFVFAVAHQSKAPGHWKRRIAAGQP